MVELRRGFVRAHPEVERRVYTEALADVVARVREGACQLGVVRPAADAAGLVRQHLTSVRMVPVAAPSHPLVGLRGRISEAQAAPHAHGVLSERGERTPDQGVLSGRTWRVTGVRALAASRSSACSGGGDGWAARARDGAVVLPWIDVSAVRCRRCGWPGDRRRRARSRWG